MQDIINRLLKEHIPFEQDIDLSLLSWSRTGKRLNILILPRSVAQLVKACNLLDENSQKFKVIGNTTNLFFFSFLDYSIMLSTRNLRSLSIEGEYCYADCGMNVSDFVRDISARGFSGFEGLEGIPGTIGGALFMNAGAYGYEISDHLIEVKALDTSKLKIVSLKKNECSFGKRKSIFHSSKLIILSAKFSLKFKKNFREISRSISFYHRLRHQYLDYSFPNLGSIFALPTSNINDLILEKINKENKFSLIFLIKKIIYRAFNSRFLTTLRRGSEINIFNVLFFNYLPSSIKSKYLSEKTLNTFLNVDNNELNILEHVSNIQSYLDGGLQLENEFVLDYYSRCEDLDKLNSAKKTLKVINESNN